MWLHISNMNAFLHTRGVKFLSGYYRFAVQAFIRSSGKKSGLGSVGSKAGSVEVFVSLQPLTSMDHQEHLLRETCSSFPLFGAGMI